MRTLPSYGALIPVQMVRFPTRDENGLNNIQVEMCVEDIRLKLSTMSHSLCVIDYDFSGKGVLQ